MLFIIITIILNTNTDSMNLKNLFFIDSNSNVVILADLNKGSYELQMMQHYIQVNTLDENRFITGSYALHTNVNSVFYEEISHMINKS